MTNVETSHNQRRIKAVLTDVHGPLLETYLTTNRLRRDSIPSINYIKEHILSDREPKIYIVSGDSRLALKRHFKFDTYGIVEHGLGIVLPNTRKTLPLYEADSDYAQLKESVVQLSEIRKKLRKDAPHIKQAEKEFMVALYAPKNMSAEDFRTEVIPQYVDGIADLSNFDISASHGVDDIKPKINGRGVINKGHAINALYELLGLTKEEVYGVEDNNWEWLIDVCFAFCPTPSSEDTLNYVGKRVNDGTGMILDGDYRNIIIKQVVNMALDT